VPDPLQSAISEVAALPPFFINADNAAAAPADIAAENDDNADNALPPPPDDTEASVRDCVS
jgi:hypothetical protein